MWLPLKMRATSSSSPPSVHQRRAERLEPALDLHERGHPPLGAIVQESHRGPEQAVGAARGLRGVEEEVQFFIRRQTPARPRDGLAITPQDPRAFLGGGLVQERGAVVGAGPRADVIQVEGPGPGTVAGHAQEDVLRPEAAVQGRLWSSRLFHEPGPARSLLEEPVQPFQQARPGGCQLAGRVPAESRQGFERRDAVAEVRGEEGHPVVAAVPADLGQEWMACAACVELGDEIDGCLEALWLAPIGERFGAEVLVDVPHPAPLSLRRGRQKPRATVDEAERRQPALHDEAVRLRDRRCVAFEHERAAGSAADSQPVDRLFQLLDVNRLVRACGTGQHPVQELAQLRHAGLPPLLEQVPESRAKIDGVTYQTSHHSPTPLVPSVLPQSFEYPADDWGAVSVRGPGHQQRLSPGGALRCGVEVRRQMRRPVRDAPAPGDAAHVDDVRFPLALDDVDAVEVDAERPAAAPGDLAKLRRGRERLPAFFLFGPRREDLLYAEEPAADRIDLPVAALGRVVALDEDGLLTGWNRRELGDAPHDANAEAIGALIRLYDQRAPVQEPPPLVGARSDGGCRRPA